jgi:hypothetical protein
MWANLEVYAALAKDAWHAANWADKLRVWFKPPGWRPADVARRFPRAPFDLARERFDPPVSAGAVRMAAVLFIATLGATTAFLWNAHLLSAWERAAAAAAIVLALALVGRLTTPGESLAAQSA